MLVLIRIITASRIGIRHRRLASPSERVWSASVKFIYKPFGFILGILAGLLGRRLFNFAWTKIDDQDPPKGTTEYAPWVKVIGAAALQGVIFKVTRVVVDRYGAIGWTLSHWFVAGREAPGPGAIDCGSDDEAALAVIRERVLEAAEVPLQEQLQRVGVPRSQARRRRVVAEQLQQDPDLRALVLLARDHRDRVAVEDLQQLLVGRGPAAVWRRAALRTAGSRRRRPRRPSRR